MAALDANLGSAIQSQAQANAGEITPALSRAFDIKDLALQFDAPSNFAAENFPADFNGAGLAILLTVGSQHVILLMSEFGGLLPEWYAAPDATGQSKLTTLAQELGMLILPDEFMPDDFRAERIPDMREGISKATPAGDAGQFSFTISAGEKKSLVQLIWPVTQGKELFQANAAANAPAAAVPPASAAESPTPAITAAALQATGALPTGGIPRIFSFEQLPNFTRSLLKIELPIRVVLAHKKQPISQIIELGPGSIIQFEKSCEEMLDLVVGDQLVAQGEAVKVGEKFGLRLTSIVLPHERFKKVLGPRAA